MPTAFLARAGSGKRIAKYRKNQVIFAQGGKADCLFYIQSGKVKVSVVSGKGKEAVIGVLEAGQFFGERCLNSGANRASSAIAMNDCLITSITKAAMLSELHDQPRFSQLFTKYLLNRNNRVEEDLIDQLFNSSEKRLARLLLLLANYGKEGNPPIIAVKLSQETLAEIIGTTRSRVSAFMNKFRKLGFISYNGEINVHSSLLDAVLHDKPQINDHTKHN